jgi:DNA-binding NarL/FixJ family response regulator
VVGEVANGLEVAETVEKFRPDILILSLVMPGAGGLELTSQVAQRWPGTLVLILSSYTDDTYIGEALRQGAMGYVLRDTVLNDLIDAVHEIMSSKRYLSPPLSDRALDLFMRKSKDSENDGLDGYATLTGREREVLHLIVEGYTNSQIADHFVISKRTVETHRANMMRKLGLRNRAELFRYALQRGLVSGEGVE